MTPKEKAEELVGLFKVPLIMSDTEAGEEIICTTISKQCALIAVKEILRVAFYADDWLYNHFLEVKQEIDKL